MGQVGQTIQVTHAMRGERDGGYGGETTGGVDSTDLTTKGSKIPGGPGGGGGNRTPGFAGDSGAPAPPRFAPPRAGKGGPARGESRLMLVSPGSGGGGGGASIGVTNGVGAANAGAGGGGGGGALKIVASGKIVVEDSASIVAMGGSGGAGVKPTAPAGTEGISFGSPGGGGSGGCILLEAQGTVDVSCESLLASGGTGGTSQAKQNLLPGSGTGGEGWIRVESAAGGVPTCAALSAESQLTAEVSVKEVAAMQVTDTGTFPSSGTVIVQDTGTGATLEEIMYLSKTPTSLNSLFRAATPVKLPSGSRVVLKGNIVPYNTPVLSGGGIVPASGTIDLGRGRDGEVHLAFEPSVDLATGQPLLDEETGAPISRWVFDTDASVLRRPSGAVVFEAASSDTDPGRLECSRLLIEPNTVLRGVGSHPLEIVVTGQAEIAGQIDVSGFDGGVLQFSTDSSTNPQPGTGGPGGPGGGSGGPGGVVNFADGNLNNKDPANTIPVHGGAGLAPRDTPAGWDRTPVQYGPVNPEDDPVPPGSFTRATGGATIRGQGCENVGVCIQSAGGGGGGGNLEEGKDGNAFPEPRTYPGAGGSIFGIADFRFGGTYWFLGGTGGAGGGGNPHVSGTYQQGYGTSAQFNFRNSALHAPGTGGGGGGGGLRLAAQSLTLRSTARIRARGGDAVQSIDLGGNGGGGAGGVVLIQVTNALSFEPGSFIDVSGGLANRPVPILPGEDRVEYPGNEHPAGNTVEINGGVGGDGAAGRIRIEAAAGSAASQTGVNPSLSAGPFLLDTQLSTGVSKTLRIGVGPGLAASSHSIMIDASQITYFEFGLPNGTDSAVLWQAARESLDQHGGAEAFSTLPGSQGILGIQDSRSLRDHEFVRFVVPFLSNSQTKEAQAIQMIELPFELSLPAP